MLDTQQLVERWQAGEDNAAQLLYDQHRDRTYRLAYGLLGNAQDAEEVAQDALTYALVNIDKFRPDKSRFSTWLHTITVSRARDKHRKKRVSDTIVDRLDGKRTGRGRRKSHTRSGKAKR